MVKSVAYTSPEWMYNHTQTQAQARTHLDIMKDIVAHRAVHVRTAAGAQQDGLGQRFEQLVSELNKKSQLVHIQRDLFEHP